MCNGTTPWVPHQWHIFATCATEMSAMSDTHVKFYAGAIVFDEDSCGCYIEVFSMLRTHTSFQSSCLLIGSIILCLESVFGCREDE